MDLTFCLRRKMERRTSIAVVVLRHRSVLPLIVASRTAATRLPTRFQLGHAVVLLRLPFFRTRTRAASGRRDVFDSADQPAFDQSRWTLPKSYASIDLVVCVLSLGRTPSACHPSGTSQRLAPQKVGQATTKQVQSATLQHIT